jgi:hypothetical protein
MHPSTSLALAARLSALALLALASTGCFDVRVGAHDAGPGSDGGVHGDAGPGHDAGWCECPPPPPGCRYTGSPCVCDRLECEDERPRCGRVTCGEGLVCCNASCNECAPPEVACAAIACAPDCSPMQAWSDGPCDRFLGLWIWDGARCVGLSGCAGCEGPDCPNAFRSPEECEAVFSGCDATGSPCGGFPGFTCGPGEWCDFEDPHHCGGADESGTCRPRPAVCPGVVDPVCGCDGRTYTNACDAQAAGVDMLYAGPCEASCAAQDARGIGDCDAWLGVAWTGASCLSVGGCSCEGADCGALWRDDAQCQAAHAHCVMVFP